MSNKQVIYKLYKGYLNSKLTKVPEQPKTFQGFRPSSKADL